MMRKLVPCLVLCACSHVVMSAYGQTPRDESEIFQSSAGQPETDFGETTPPLLRQLRQEPAIDSSATIRIEKIVLTNSDAVSATTTQAILSDYEDRQLGLPELQSLANELTSEYQRNGFFLSRARIEPQSFEANTLVVRVSEGFVSDITIDEKPDPRLQPYFAKFMAGRPARLQDLQEAMAQLRFETGVVLTEPRIIANDALADSYTLAFASEEARPQWQISIFDRGVRRGESLRAVAQARFKSVLLFGDDLSLGTLLKPTALSELTYLTGRYAAPLNIVPGNIFIEGTTSNSRPRSALPDRDLEGDLTIAALGYSIPLLLEPKRRFITSAKFEWADASEREDGSILYQDKLRTIQLSATYDSARSRNRTVSARLEYTGGLDAFNASTGNSVFLSRADGDSQFNKIAVLASLKQRFARNFSVSVGLDAQYADSPLLFLEEFSFGGGNFGRGYDYGEILGDSGIAAYLEAGLNGDTNGLVNGWEIYGFGDVGVVWNQGTGLSSDGEPLYSAGAGVRLNLSDNISVSYEAAHPLSDAPFTLDDTSTRHRVQLTAKN